MLKHPRLALASAFATSLLALAARAEDPKPNDATLGAKPPQGAVVLFNGRNLDGWLSKDGKSPAGWTAIDGVLHVKPGKGDIQTDKNFGDFTLHLEFNIPNMPDKHGQARGNSGVYLTGNTELQVLDSYGLKSQNNDCGAIYLQITPKYNVCKPPLQWQTYDVDFKKARVEGGKVLAKARITVKQNGVVIIDDAEIKPTPGGNGTPEGSAGPLMLQDHGNLVQYRNIWIVPKN